MAEYRMYTLDRLGRIGLAEPVQAESDGQALAKVRELRPTALKWEVWKGNRLIATLDDHERTADTT
jgi:hypothetical protein